MNRHERRTAAKRDLQHAVRTVHNQGQGIVKITSVRPADCIEMAADVLAGHLDHVELLGIVGDLVARSYEASEAGRPFLCCACPAELTGPFAVVIASPGEDGALKEGLGLGVCLACGPSLDAIEAAALKGLQGFWPDLRRINVHPQSGRA